MPIRGWAVGPARNALLSAPLTPHRGARRMKVGVIGSGIGGLLVGAALLKRGYEVMVFEKLSCPGGRFTNLEYKGFQLSTGALHMIPHSEKGPMGGILRQLGAKVEIVASEPTGLFRVDGGDYPFEELSGLLPLGDKLMLAAALAKAKITSGGEESVRDWLQGSTRRPLVFQVADSFFGWALSLHSGQVSLREFIAISKNTERLGGPGIPMGGCGGVTSALVDLLESEGGVMRYRSRVEKVEVGKGGVSGIIADGERHPFDLVVSDIGPKATSKLLGDRAQDPEGMDALVEAAGIKICVACDEAMLGHSGVLFTPHAKRIGGVNEVTNADPSLAPPGKHLLMSHQALDPARDVREEIRLGKEDLRTIFPDFDKHCEVLMAQTYKGEWPVNRVPSGVHLQPEGPVGGLFYVGDAIKPEGWMESEGVAAGVELALKGIEELQ